MSEVSEAAKKMVRHYVGVENAQISAFGDVWHIEGDRDNAEELAQHILDLQHKCDALAAENAALKESVDHAAGCIHAAEVEGLQDALESRDGERLSDLVHRRLCHAYLPAQSMATDAYLNSVRADGVQMLLNKYAPHTIASSEASEFAAQLRAGKDGE